MKLCGLVEKMRIQISDIEGDPNKRETLMNCVIKYLGTVYKNGGIKYEL